MRGQVFNVGRASALVVAIVAVIVVAMPVAAANSPQVQGTKCTKTGATRVVKGVSYSCTKIGKTLKWQIASKRTATTTVPRELAAIELANKINSFVAPMRTRNQAVPMIEYRFGPSVSEADRTMTRQLAEAFFKYGSFPQLANYRNAISVALTNEELVATTAGWQDTSNRPIFGGSYWGTGVYALTLQNFTGHRCPLGGTTVADANECAANGNGGDMGRFRTRVNVLHEISNGGKVALMGFDPTQDNKNKERLPLWVSTGFSNVYGAMLLAVIDGATYTNPNISADEARRCINAPISLSSIPGVFGDAASRCRGTGTGDFANELLIARFGLDKMLEFIKESRSIPLNSTWTNWSSPWSSLFSQIFLQSPESFEKDVETYRLAVSTQTFLPEGFLDAKSRT